MPEDSDSIIVDETGVDTDAGSQDSDVGSDANGEAEANLGSAAGEEGGEAGDEEIVRGMPKKLKERFDRVNSDAKKYRTEAESHKAELAKLQARLGVADKFVSRYESDPDFAKYVDSFGVKPKAESGGEQPVSDVKDKVAAELFDGAKFADLDRLERWAVEKELRDRQSVEARNADESQQVLNQIAQEIVEVLKDEKFKAIKADPIKVYNFMVDTGLADPSAAAWAVYRDDLAKYIAESAEKAVIAKKSKVPKPPETGSRRPAADMDDTDEDFVSSVADELRASGKIPSRHFMTA